MTTAPAPTKTTSHNCGALAQALQSKCLPKLAAEARTIQYAFAEQEKRIRELEAAAVFASEVVLANAKERETMYQALRYARNIIAAQLGENSAHLVPLDAALRVSL